MIVYKITCKLNNKIYIGQTTETLQKRWKRHIGYQLNDGTYLHNSMKKYGVENFIIEQIDSANNQEELNILELFYINDLKADFNINKSGEKCGGDTLSNHPNKEEIGIKISNKFQKGNNPNASKVLAINIVENYEIKYNSLKECMEDLYIPRHDIISRRCREIIKSPYNKTWLFKYI